MQAQPEIVIRDFLNLTLGDTALQARGDEPLGPPRRFYRRGVRQSFIASDKVQIAAGG